jgi:hypothetical protein
MAIEDRGSAGSSCNGRIDEDNLALLALALTPNLGPKRIANAMRGLQCASQLFSLTRTELEGLRVPADAAPFIFDGKARRAAEEEAEGTGKKDATLITLASPEYPERAEGNLRSAAGAVGTGRCGIAVAAIDCDCGDEASIAIWCKLRRCLRGIGGSTSGDCERNGTRNRYLRAQGSAGSADAECGSVGDRN